MKPAAPPLCPTFEALAVRTWDYLLAGDDMKLRLGEETLTDINLVDLQRAHPTQVQTVKFTKRQERRNGADWELWLFEGGSALALRVQAKKLYADGAYLSLSGKGRRQARQLISSARADGLTPLYCFYNATKSAQRSDWPLLPPDVAVEQMGCAVARAEAIEAAVSPRGPVTQAALGHHQLPWRELVCRRESGVSGIGGVLAALEGAFRGVDAEAPLVRDEAEAPDYVVAIREGAPPTRRGKRVPARRVTVLDYDRRSG
jgi:hypothetical protein